jgi:hypothetical protein
MTNESLVGFRMQKRKLEKSELNCAAEFRCFDPKTRKPRAQRPGWGQANAGNFKTFPCTHPTRQNSGTVWLTTQSVVEPVSAPNSLLTGKLTGNFVISACARRFPRPDASLVQWFTAEFPTQLNREFSGAYQGKISAIQGTWERDSSRNPRGQLAGF